MSNLRGGDTIGGYPIPGMFGTNGKIAKFNGPLITDSLISDDGTTVSISGKMFVKGNLGVNNASPIYGYHQLAGGLRLQGLDQVIVTPTVNGTTGITSNTYYVYPKDANGLRGYATAVVVTNCNATMSAINSVTLSWAAVPGAVSYDICKNSYGTSLVMNLVATSFTDIGQALTSGYTTPNVDESSQLFINGQLIMQGVLSTGSTTNRLQYRITLNDGGGRVNESINVDGGTASAQVYHATQSEPAMKIIKDPNGDLFTIHTAPSGTAGNPITWTRQFRIIPGGNVYIGANDAVSATSTNRRYLSVQGSADAGVLELSQYGVADAAGIINGILHFSDSNNTATEKRTAGVIGWTDPTSTTANARGGKLSFYTRTEGVGGLFTEKGYFDKAGVFKVGSNGGLGSSLYLAGLAFNRSVGDGTIYDNTKPAYQVQMNLSQSNRFEIQAYNSAGSLVATPFIINSAGDMTFNNSVTLPSSPTNSLAGQINSMGVVKFSAGGSAQGVYVNHLGVSGSWADNDANTFAGGIYTYAGLKTKGDITMNVPFSGSNIGIKFNSNVNLSSDYADIRYYDDSNTYSYWGDSTECSALVISVGNDGRNTNSDVIVLTSPAAVIIDSQGFRMPVLSGSDPAGLIAGMIWLRSDL